MNAILGFGQLMERDSDLSARDRDRLSKILVSGYHLLEPDTGQIRMLNPFSAVPTAYRVEAGGRSWVGNCVWAAFGIPAALGVDGHVSATCLDCGEALEADVVDGRVEPDDLVTHILLPARRWWDDIVFT